MTMQPGSRALVSVLWFAACFLLVPSLALAGPNAGGTLILHANPNLVYSQGTQSYCGQAGLDSCSAAVTSVPWDPGTRIVFHALAAFPPESSPRLKGMSFGIDYDGGKFIIESHGTCADFEVPDGGWPAPGTGVGQSWTTGTRTDLLTEAYWLAGYAYGAQEDSTVIELVPHPTQGGVFVSDAVPAEVDTIARYGTLGFGESGELACPGRENDGPTGEDQTVPSGDDEAELLQAELSRFYVWIDGNPIAPEPEAGYRVETIGDSIITINSFLTYRRSMNPRKRYSPTPMGRLHQQVDESTAAAREEGKTNRDIRISAAAVLMAAPDLVKSVHVNEYGELLSATYVDGTTESFEFGPPPMAPPPLTERASRVTKYLQNGYTIVVVSSGSGWLYVPPNQRNEIITEIAAARAFTPEGSLWHGWILPASVVRAFSAPGALNKVGR